ncbi:MAG: hypothetical protein EBS68_09910 [Rhodobacteraceae bacterium]|nr:hypothetical protein [Paracoccaceae bacterium]
MDKENHPGLDPQDWDEYRTHAHALLDACIDRLTEAREHPWIPVPPQVLSSYSIPAKPLPIGSLRETLVSQVMPYATGNTHPRFFGWVHGTGLATGLLSEMVAATMNSNLGGRDHGLNYMEREVIAWARDTFGFPHTSSGLLVAGTSQATVIALSSARIRALGPDVRKKGIHGTQPLTIYSGTAAHNALRKAIELLGIGTDNLRLVPDGENGPDPEELERLILADKANGLIPMALIATAGSVDLGRFDNLNAMADLAAKHGLWLHIDGAFGAWTRLADEPWRSLSNGIERADGSQRGRAEPGGEPAQRDIVRQVHGDEDQLQSADEERHRRDHIAAMARRVDQGLLQGQIGIRCGGSTVDLGGGLVTRPNEIRRRQHHDAEADEGDHGNQPALA